MRNARNGSLHGTVPGAASLPGRERSSPLPAIPSVIPSVRPRPPWMAPPAFFLSCSPARHGPGRYQPENSSFSFEGRTHASTARPARPTPLSGIFTTSCVPVFCCIIQACICYASEAAADALKNPFSSAGRTHASTARPTSAAATSH